MRGDILIEIERRGSGYGYLVQVQGIVRERGWEQTESEAFDKCVEICRDALGI